MNLLGSFSESDKTKNYVLPTRSGFQLFMARFHEDNPTRRFLSGPAASYTNEFLPFINDMWLGLSEDQREEYGRQAILDGDRCRLDCERVFPFARQEEGELEDGGGEVVEKVWRAISGLSSNFW